jgi:uncharacterized protein (DUF362 family)
MSTITVYQGEDRPAGVRAVVEALGPEAGSRVKGKRVVLKPNFNTADPAPGSTDNRTLGALIDLIWEMGAAHITLGERSWQSTHQVMAEKNVAPLLAEKGVEVIVFDDLPERDWIEFKTPGHHWPHGFRVARPIVEAECLVATCCLKTHQYGGVFTLSLKLAVGTAPGRLQMPAYMDALHSSPHQRKMIAELNTAFTPDLIVLDGVDAFVDGGPATGKRVKGRLMLAGDDRVAMDAVGLAALKHLGANRAVMDTPIFAQEQIARAVELGLGAKGPEDVKVVPAGADSAALASELSAILGQG